MEYESAKLVPELQMLRLFVLSQRDAPAGKPRSDSAPLNVFNLSTPDFWFESVDTDVEEAKENKEGRVKAALL
jgi:hypothetical protein